jgi:1,4-dihydroxy-2-naphthoyl-CoA hydrolase
LLGIEFVAVEHGHVELRLPLRDELLAPNGYLHAATVVALADTACGYGCTASLPSGAGGFTTIELKTNFLGTAREGTLECVATLVHGGRTTQVWDATIRSGAKTIAVFRCTQLVLYESRDRGRIRVGPQQPSLSATRHTLVALKSRGLTPAFGY